MTLYYQCRFEKDTDEGIETTIGWVEGVKGLHVGSKVTLKDEEGYWRVKTMGTTGITEKEFKSMGLKSREWNNNI
jgi:hypothetical protein